MEIIALLTSVQIAMTTVFSLTLPQQRTSDQALLPSAPHQHQIPALLPSAITPRSLPAPIPSAHYQHSFPALCVHNTTQHSPVGKQFILKCSFAHRCETRPSRRRNTIGPSGRFAERNSGEHD